MKKELKERKCYWDKKIELEILNIKYLRYIRTNKYILVYFRSKLSSDESIYYLLLKKFNKYAIRYKVIISILFIRIVTRMF